MEAPEHPLDIFNTSGIELPFKNSEAAFLLDLISEEQNVAFSSVEIAFVDENEIVRINTEFLQHDYITDIITFRYDENVTNLEIEGTLYCCSQRIREQASEFNQTEKREFLRIIIHGLLHLCGYNDSTINEKKEMTRLEDHFLNLI
ncbi:MAG: rRNA maturation RNase YbeY [Balneolaceae bacterium]